MIEEGFNRPRFTEPEWNQYWGWLTDTKVDIATDRTPKERLVAFLAAE